VCLIRPNTVPPSFVGGEDLEEHVEVAEISIASLSSKLSLICTSYLLTLTIMYYDLCVRFKVLAEVKMSMLIFWVVRLYGLVGRYQRFAGTYCLRVQP
jgi:hypothetical protein